MCQKSTPSASCFISVRAQWGAAGDGGEQREGGESGQGGEDVNRVLGYKCEQEAPNALY